MKFHEVKVGQLFTFSYYLEENIMREHGGEIIWVFMKLNDTHFVTVHSFERRRHGEVTEYKADDDSPCTLISASYDIIRGE